MQCPKKNQHIEIDRKTSFCLLVLNEIVIKVTSSKNLVPLNIKFNSIQLITLTTAAKSNVNIQYFIFEQYFFLTLKNKIS